MSGVLWSAGGSAAAKLFSAAVFIVLVRLLSPEEFGVVSLATVFVALLAIFVEGGLTRALIQRSVVTRLHLDTAFWLNIAVGVVLAGALIALAPLIASWLRSPDLAPILRALSISLLLAPLSVVQSAIMQREMRFRELAMRSLFASAIGSLVGLAVAIAGGGAWALVTSLLGSSLASVLALWRVSTWRPGLALSRQAAADLFGFSSSILANRLVNAASVRATQLLVGARLSEAELGLFSVSSRVKLNIADLFVFTTTRVAFPTFSRLQHEPERLARAYLKGVQLSIAASLPAFAGMAVLAPEIVPTVFGKQWLAAVPVMAIISLTGFFSTLGAYDMQIVSAKGKPHVNLGVGVVEMFLAIGFTLATLPHGIVAVAAGQVVKSAVLWPVRFVFVRRTAGVRVRQLVVAIWAPVTASILMSVSLHGLRLTSFMPSSDWSRLVLLVGLGGLIYAGLLAVLAPSVFRTLIDLLGQRRARTATPPIRRVTDEEAVAARERAEIGD